MTSQPAFLLMMLDPEANEPADVCTGPDPAGACPRADEGRPLPCAGRLLVPAHGSARDAVRVAVPAGADECPLPLLAAGGR